MCDKSFVSQEYLIGHVNRRHQIQQQNNGLQMSGFQKVQEQKQSSPPAVSGIEKSVLMDELSQIKERLQVTEQDLMNERNARETLIQRVRSLHNFIRCSFTNDRCVLSMHNLDNARLKYFVSNLILTFQSVVLHRSTGKIGVKMTFYPNEGLLSKTWAYKLFSLQCKTYKFIK